LQSFRYAGAKLRNELPDHFRKDMSLDQFKNLIPFLYFFNFLGIRFSTKVANKWAIVKVGHNKGVVDCKFF
jgi:hypothetical protein